MVLKKGIKNIHFIVTCLYYSSIGSEEINGEGVARILHTILDSTLFRVSLRIVFHGYKSRFEQVRYDTVLTCKDSIISIFHSILGTKN